MNIKTKFSRIKLFPKGFSYKPGLLLLLNCTFTANTNILNNTSRTGSFKLFKRPLPGFLTILTL